MVNTFTASVLYLTEFSSSESVLHSTNSSPPDGISTLTTNNTYVTRSMYPPGITQSVSPINGTDEKTDHGTRMWLTFAL